MKNLFYFIFPLIVTSGCCFNSSPPKTEYFNISTPSIHAQYNYRIEVDPINVEELYGSKMVFSKAPHSIFFDNFNRWAQSPHKMLALYFNIYFNNPASPTLKNNSSPLKLNASILKFVCDLTKKECLLCVEVSVVNSMDNKTLFKEIYIEKQNMNKLTASSFASSMSKAVKTVSEKIEKEMNNIYKDTNLKKGTE